MRALKFLLTTLLVLAAAGCVTAESTRPSAEPPPSDRGGAGAPSRSAYRGELLYENHCLGCHTSIAHVRENRRAQTVSEVQAWVARWAGELKLAWTTEEVGDVARFLVRRYYKFDDKSARAP